MVHVLKIDADPIYLVLKLIIEFVPHQQVVKQCNMYAFFEKNDLSMK